MRDRPAVGMKLKPWTITDDHSEEQARALFARVVKCTENDITFQASTSAALSLVAANVSASLEEGDEILILQDQMSSNVYPWQSLISSHKAQLRIVDFPPSPDTDLTTCVLSVDWARVKVCALAPCHWTDGSLLDLKAISDRCHERGAVLVVDATQAVGAMELDVSVIQPDFLCASVHKWLFGPYGICLMYCHPKWHAKLKPLDHHEHNRQGANGDDCIPFEMGKGYLEAFKPGARCVDVGGRPNPILFPMLNDSLSQVLTWGVARLERTLKILTDAVVSQGQLLGFYAPAKHAGHLVGLRCGPKLQSQGVTIDELYAHLKCRSIYVSSRFGALRIGVHAYNTLEDVGALFTVISEYLVKLPKIEESKPVS